MSHSMITCGNCQEMYDMGDYSQGTTERGAPLAYRKDCPHCGFLHIRDNSKNPWEEGFNKWVSPTKGE